MLLPGWPEVCASGQQQQREQQWAPVSQAKQQSMGRLMTCARSHLPACAARCHLDFRGDPGELDICIHA